MEQPTLRGGDQLFFHPAVMRFNRMVASWQSRKPVALLLGCTAAKPYSLSFIHRKVIAAIRSNELAKHVQEYIVGEPLTICPREWERRYPAAHYDFPPAKLGTEGREEFVRRLDKFFSQRASSHQTWITFAPNHHRDIIREAWNGRSPLATVSYNVYSIPRLVAILKKHVR